MNVLGRIVNFLFAERVGFRRPPAVTEEDRKLRALHDVRMARLERKFLQATLAVAAQAEERDRSERDRDEGEE